MIILHSSTCLEYEFPHHPETPTRVRAAVLRLQKKQQLWRQPLPSSPEDILRVHSPAHLKSVLSGSFADADTPWNSTLFSHALLSSGSACQAAEAALAGQQAFSLMRPPGHHAERDRVMGFCYFNNIAVAVAKILSLRSVSSQGGSQPVPTPPDRVAILDFDCHHGNGTEDIFLGNDRVLFVSLHQSPCYPGTGLRSNQNCHNYPLPPHTGETDFLAALDLALQKIMNFQPQMLAISAGFDAHKNDPITQMGLDTETFGKVGEKIKALQIPSFAVLEGGYGTRFAACVESFIDGWKI
jgi:acetoin utilization deacetylase AcuC-like enzyme